MSDTMFDFFDKVNIVEFKSENASLTLRKLTFYCHRFFASQSDGTSRVSVKKSRLMLPPNYLPLAGGTSGQT